MINVYLPSYNLFPRLTQPYKLQNGSKITQNTKVDRQDTCFRQIFDNVDNAVRCV